MQEGCSTQDSNNSSPDQTVQPRLQLEPTISQTWYQPQLEEKQHSKKENESKVEYNWKKRAAHVVQRIAYLPVPPETRYLLGTRRKRVYECLLLFLGLFLLIAVTLWFLILFFVIFARCGSVQTVSTRDIQDAACTKVTIPTYATLIMDNRGQWSTQASFTLDESLWKVRMFGYSSTSVEFQRDVRTMMIEAEQLSQILLNNKDWLTRLQVLSFADTLRSNGTRQGQITLNLDLDVTALSHDFSGFRDKFQDFSQLIDLGEEGLQEMIEAVEGCGFDSWRRTDESRTQKDFSRFEHLGAVRNFGVFVPSDFATAIVYNNSDCNQPMSASLVDNNKAEDIFKFSKNVPISVSGERVDNELRGVDGIPAFLSLAEFRWDMKQVLHLDFCNKYPQMCRIDFMTGNLYPTVQHPNTGHWGYQWSTNTQEYIVIPQFFSPFGCQCEGQIDETRGCVSLLGMFLHIYSTSEDLQSANYVLTYSLQLHATGMINTRLVSSPTHCVPYSPSNNKDLQSIYISPPADLESGFYDCEVKSCMGILERLAQSQLNDELVFIIAFVLILFLSVYVWHRIHMNASGAGNAQKIRYTTSEEKEDESNLSMWERTQAFLSQVFLAILPEESIYLLRKKIIQILLGMLLLGGTFGLFIFLIFHLNQCETNYVVSETDQSDGQNKACSEMLVSTSGVFLLDHTGRWQTQSGFDANYAFWALEFESFQANEDGLRNALSELRDQINDVVNSTIGSNWRETFMRLIWNNISIPGEVGQIRVQPNMDLIPINIWGVDLFLDMSQILGKEQAKERAALVQDYCSSWTNPQENAFFVNQSPLGFYKFLYLDGMKGGLIRDDLENGTCARVEVDQDDLVSPYPTFFNAFYSINKDEFLVYELASDARQILALDFCNSYPDQCELAIDLETKIVRDSSGLLESKQNKKGQWGYLWRTGLNPYSKNVTFFIVPETLPTYECMDNCDDPEYAQLECVRSSVQLSHFFLEEDDDVVILDESFSSGDYLGTFGSLKGTTGKWNRDLSTEGPTHCQIDSNLKFTEEASNIDIPFNPSKNLYDCTIKNCPSIFERLAQAFGDVEFIFMMLILTIIITFVISTGFCVEEEKLQEFVEVEDTQPIAVYLPKSIKKNQDLKPQLRQSSFSRSQRHLDRAEPIGRRKIAREVGLVVPAFKRAFELPVPEQGYRVLQRRKFRWFLGLLVFVLLCGIYIYMVVRYVKNCHSYDSLTLNPDGEDCEASILGISGEFRIDSYGRFDVEEEFDQSSAYWVIMLDSYQADKQRFREDLQNLTSRVDDQLQELQSIVDDMHFLYIMQEMFMMTETVQGLNGTMTITANIDLSRFLDPLYVPFSMHDPLYWQFSEDIDRVELNGIYNCEGNMWRQGLGTIYGQGRELFLATPYNGIRQQDRLYKSWESGNCSGGTQGAFQNDFSSYRQMYFGQHPDLGSPVNNENIFHPQSMEIRIPLLDLLIVDFCRRHNERCKELMNIDKVGYINPVEEVGLDRLGVPSQNTSVYLLSPTTARSIEVQTLQRGNQDTVLNPSLGLLFSAGLNPEVLVKVQDWNNRIENIPQLNVLPKRLENSTQYYAIPSITPHTSCFTCSESRQIGWEECQRAIEVRLEFLELQPSLPLSESPQFGLLYAGFRTDGYMNEELSRGDLCNPNLLGFQNIDFSSIIVPYAAESGLWSCKIKDCKEFLEIIGDAFGNVQELFILVSMLLFVFFVYLEVCCLVKFV